MLKKNGLYTFFDLKFLFLLVFNNDIKIGENIFN